MDFEAFKAKYFRFWNVEDRPADNTFDKYQKTYFREKTFDVDVSDGQLNLEFQGENWACCVSAVVIFPVAKAARGRGVSQVRRGQAPLLLRQLLQASPAPPDRRSAPSRPKKTGAAALSSFIATSMQDVYYNDTPCEAEVAGRLRGEAFAGEYEPVTLCLAPLQDLGKVAVTVGDLAGPAGRFRAAAIDVGFVSYRISRVTMEGTVYTISPRLIMPGGVVDMPEGLTARFWMTVRTPADARPGVYKGTVTIRSGEWRNCADSVGISRPSGTLDPVDIPAGPFGYTIGIPWYGDDPAASRLQRADDRKRACGKCAITASRPCSGIAVDRLSRVRRRQAGPRFPEADAQMKLVKEMGFLAVVGYGGGVSGFDAYSPGLQAMVAAGYKDYAAFVKAIYAAVKEHAERPMDSGVLQPGRRAARRRSGPVRRECRGLSSCVSPGPALFHGGQQLPGQRPAEPAFPPGAGTFMSFTWNDHDEAAVQLLQKAGSNWAFYNGGNRWTFGTYMYKAAKQYGMKFRLSWHWNVVAGDPYYALDCREDDFAWCNASPDGRLIPSVEFERIREGLDDYRRLDHARPAGGTESRPSLPPGAVRLIKTRHGGVPARAARP